MTDNRSGSALLIVLGMLAFMVISSVAFSAYMRFSRLPSSYLRQTSASRQLVKAALAEAIDEIDAAIGNNPHPGVGDRRYDFPRQYKSDGTSAESANRNKWLGRVYIGCTNSSQSTESASQCMVGQNETVSPLCLEALAYLPPPLVNEARYYSRRSQAAKWHQFPYDVGRYAFCAIDVSDYFDVNAIHADIARSSFPNRQISLAYLFENDGHTSAGGGRLGTPSAWDTFLKPFRSDELPLVSLADWNLAVHDQKPGGVFSPFGRYVENNYGSFYNVSEDSPEANAIRRMTFVTDGLFTGGTTASDAIDLANPQNQPFTKSELENDSPNFVGITSSGSLCSQRLLKYMPNIALAALYDYLDEDRVPLSLGIPTLERVPMICGVQPNLGGAMVTIKASAANNGASPSSSYDSKTGMWTFNCEIGYCIDGSQLGMPNLSATAVYPFHHKDGVSETFKVQGRMALFFTSGTMDLRPGNAVADLQFSENATSIPKPQNGVILIKGDGEPSLAFSTLEKQQDVIKDSIRIAADGSSLQDGATYLGGSPILTVKYTWESPSDPNGNAVYPDLQSAMANPSASKLNDGGNPAKCDFMALKSDGSIDSDFQLTGDALIDKFKSGKDIYLNFAVWLRVLDTNGKTVDMVPACGQDDNLNNSSNWRDPMSQIILQNYFGKATPLMRFDTGVKLSFKLDGNLNPQSAAAPTAAAADPAAVMVGDPRFNYAPESWFACTAIDKNSWLQKNGATDKDKDGDIFMQVSDQGYMQSVYELANIIRFGEEGFGNFGDNVSGRLKTPMNAWSGKTFPSRLEDAANSAFMWSTYDPLGRYNNDGDGFEELNIVNDGGGFKVNPYTDSTNVMMAAFVNTPHDWRCSSTNNQEKTFEEMGAEEFNREYAWNEYSSGEQIAYRDLENVAGWFMAGLRANADSNWEDVWAGLGWACNGQSDPEGHLLDNLQLTGDDDLYNTDKKFLYGFWHDCFAVKQQLFLVFVRAEPMMMGGGAANQTPPQLGARAMALVWRDPAATQSDNAPHKTRVLFYRQFD